MKLYVPAPQGKLVARPRLTERLDLGAASTLMLVSAPAGFGKTTLLAEWLARQPAASVAWLSLDREDNDPRTFWTYFIAALRTAAPDIGASALSLLEASPAAPVATTLTTLINDLVTAATDIVLVLDDYHVIDALEVHEAMAYLLEHRPPRLHLVIATRSDPPWPLARLRARGQLVELRASDLRFTDAEASAYLSGMGLRLTATDVAALEGRTEGWIAALQLAALSLQGRPDGAAFIAGFAGDDRYVVDYLVEEVLARQSDAARTFLLQTSVLRRLTGPLCDAVTGGSGGKAMLEALDRANLFLVPLDDRRQWYRYHHLFADVLQARLLDEQPDRVPELHRRASSWYQRNGSIAEAVSHSLRGEDFAKAADLVELAVPAMRRQRQEAVALGWMMSLPEPLLRERPVLNVHYAGALLSTGRLDGVEARLVDAERWLEPNSTGTDRPSTAARVVDETEFLALPAMIALYRAAQALATGDVQGTTTHAQQALSVSGDDAHLVRGAAAGLLGLAYWSSGDLEAAHRSYAESTTNLEQAGHIADTLGCAIALADIRLAQGRPKDALRTYERALALAAEQPGPPLRGTADMLTGMSGIQLEFNDLKLADECLARAETLGDHAGLPQSRYRLRVALAGAREARGDLEGAVALLDEAERMYVGDFFPNVRPIPAIRARVYVRQGNVRAALDWARDQGLSAHDDLHYLREFEHLTLARALVAHGEGAELLHRLLEAAEAGKRVGSIIEILVLQALQHQSLNELPSALAKLERALSLAEPAGYVRTLVSEGEQLAALLRLAAEREIAPDHVRRLLAALGSPAAAPPVQQHLIEPLSERELVVLRLLRTDLDGPGIARELVVSLHTVRSHTKRVYAKLGVNNRRAAVRRAVELEILPRTSS